MLGLENIYKHYNLQLFLCSGLLTLSSANYGFDVQGFAKTQAMTPFIQRFGQCDAQGLNCFLPTWWLSMFNSFPFLAQICGIAIGSMISARYGRRMTCFTMSLWACVGATIVLTSQTREQMMVARILNYIYVGMELAVIPVYQSEIMPAPVRGFAVASYQMSFGIGAIFVSIIAKFTNNIPNDWSWRIVFCFFYVVPLIVASLIWFLPESPRWLISKGRVEEARVNLRRVRVDSSVEAIEEEVERIQLGLEAAKDSGRYRDLFIGDNKRRTLIVLGSNFFIQSTGQAFTSIYGPLFVLSLKFIDVFLWGLITSISGFVVVIISMLFVDRVGRRPMMIGGSASQALWLLICGALGCVSNPSTSVKYGIVFSTLFFGLSFSLAWAPLNYIITTEMSQQRLRDKTQRLGSWMNISTNFIVTFSLPYAMNEPGNLGSKVGFIFGGMSVCACLFAYFCIPECKGRAFEEINLLFYHRVPARHSRKWKPEHDVSAELAMIAGRRDTAKTLDTPVESEKEQTFHIEQKAA